MPEIKDQKETIPLLMEQLSQPERVFLTQIVQHAGYQVLIKLFNACCARATEHIVRLDPEKPDYERLLPYRSQRSRNFSECTTEILKSVDYHTGVVKMADANDESDANNSVDKVFGKFGIHKVPPKAKRVIGQKKEESSKEAVVNESK